MIIIRLWHKDLIPYLPKNQLLGQWRECCCIVKNIADNDTPNHILVNKIMDYPIEHFIAYTTLVKQEMQKRGYKCNASRFTKWLEWDAFKILKDEIFEDWYNNRYLSWHNNRYLKQCLYNLQEKYDCGGISQEEWDIIENKFKEYF